MLITLSGPQPRKHTGMCNFWLGYSGKSFCNVSKQSTPHGQLDSTTQEKTMQMPNTRVPSCALIRSTFGGLLPNRAPRRLHYAATARKHRTTRPHRLPPDPAQTNTKSDKNIKSVPNEPRYAHANICQQSSIQNNINLNVGFPKRLGERPGVRRAHL